MLCVHGAAGGPTVDGWAFSYGLTACPLEHRSKGLGSSSTIQQSKLRVSEWLLWTSKCSGQENICRCLPCPIHTSKWAKQSRTAPECNSDSLLIPQHLKKCWHFSCPVGRKMNLCFGRLTGQILPKGCLASGLFLPVFDAPADLSPINMFYKLLNVFFLQKSVHLATLTLTPSFIHSPCWFSDSMYPL